MEQTLLRYNRGVAEQSMEHPSDEQNAESNHPIDVNALKEEYLKLRSEYMKLNGKELEGLDYKELQHIEQQLNDGISQVKKRKEQVLIDQVNFSRLQEQKAILENEALRKQIDELQKKTSSNPFEINPLQRRYSPNSSKAEYDYASEEDDDHDDDDDHSDTSLHLGLASEVGRKRKIAKIEPISNDSGSQVASE
ncbi:Transcription factor, K-box [Corchorus capsularis]|uniref:Transcription factor, K-box n=1 Tax=Corchorus capsularis TaxID=210143 RepID=A0A1R3HM35_COCAP|nr:Transcription factor, K-box [Corchorus capsularis]